MAAPVPDELRLPVTESHLAVIRAKAAIRFMRFFQPSRAVKVVTSPGVAPLNEATWSSLEKLVCPAGGESQESLKDILEAFQALVDQLPDYSLNHEALVGAMCKMSKGKRGGS